MSIDFQPLFDLVRERPDEEHNVHKLPPCPGCGSTNHEGMSTYMTCMGTLGVDVHKYPELDCNNISRSVCCPDCGFCYVIHSKYNNVWVTQPYSVRLPNGKEQPERIVARGMPSSGGDRWVYHCAKCEDGLVRREYYKKDSDELLFQPGQPEVLSYVPKRGGKQYRAAFHCDSCDARIITPDYEHWYCGPPKVQLTPEEEEYREKVAKAVMSGNVFTVPGPAIGDVSRLAKADFD